MSWISSIAKNLQNALKADAQPTQQEATQSALDKAAANKELLNTNVNTDTSVSYDKGDWLGNSYLTNADGESFLFVPKDSVNKGVVIDAWWKPGKQAQMYNQAFLNPDNFKGASQYTYNGTEGLDRKSTRLNSSHIPLSRMPSSA